MSEILDVIHKTIYQFFDVCGDDEEVPMSDKDKLLLEVNKAICNALKALERKTGHWIIKWDEDNREQRNYCSVCNEWEYTVSRYCPNCGAKMESEDKE